MPSFAYFTYFVIPIITFFASWIILEKQYLKTGKIHTRSMFVLISFVISQIFAIPLSIISFLPYQNYHGDAGIPILIFLFFCHLTMTIVTILLAFPIYGQVIKRVSKVSGVSLPVPKLGKFYYSVISALLMVVAYITSRILSASFW